MCPTDIDILILILIPPPHPLRFTHDNILIFFFITIQSTGTYFEFQLFDLHNFTFQHWVFKVARLKWNTTVNFVSYQLISKHLCN